MKLFFRENNNVSLILNSGLFDLNYFSRQVKTSLKNERCAIKHYLKYGVRNRLNPSERFNTSFYLNEYEDVASSGINPLVHYINLGISEGRRGLENTPRGGPLSFSEQVELIRNSGKFDHEFYLREYPDVDRSGIDPIVHYLTTSLSEDRNPSASFSTVAYLEEYPDVKESKISPLVHYILHGESEGRIVLPPPTEDPSNNIKMFQESDLFDEQFYLDSNPDVKQACIDPAAHYMISGFKEGREPSKYFSANYYLAANPDLANLDMNLLVHYLNYGRYENRRCSPHYIDGYKLPFPPRGKFNTQTLPVRNCRALSKDLIVGIHLHCHFVDVAVEMIKKLKYFPGDFRLFVSVTSEKKKQEIQHIFDMEELTVNRLIVSENRGRDISPMLVDFSEDLLNCDVCLHLHTKKSKEREKFGLEWRRDIESKLLFNCNYIGNILSSFENNPNIGILAPEPFWKVIPYMHTGANKEITDYLLKELGVNVRLSDNEFFDFPAGSMFWFRPKAIDQLLKYNFQYKDFPKEPIPDDGTLAHAVERCLILVCKHNAFDSYNIKPLPYEKSWPGYLAPKISIVVPVYNAQAWIKSTIESVLEQDATHVPYELILVENGSTDGSDKIARHYADLFDNIKYVEEKIKGAGDARNAGIRNATGDYITFLDADDILATDALGNMFAAISSEKADVVVSSLVIFDEDGYSRPLPYDSKDNNVISFDGIEDKHVNVVLLKALFSDFGPCAKLYRREFLSKQQISFPSGRNFEDNWFIYCVYLTARRIAILQGPTYFYRKYQQLVGKSQSTSTDEKSLDDQIWVIEKLLGEKLGETKEDVRIIVKNALVTKLGWEFNRLELSSVAYERLSNSDFLLQEIHSEGMWLLLGDKANELKTMHENVISCKDGS